MIVKTPCLSRQNSEYCPTSVFSYQIPALLQGVREMIYISVSFYGKWYGEPWSLCSQVRSQRFSPSSMNISFDLVCYQECRPRSWILLEMSVKWDVSNFKSTSHNCISTCPLLQPNHLMGVTLKIDLFRTSQQLHTEFKSLYGQNYSEISGRVVAFAQSRQSMARAGSIHAATSYLDSICTGKAALLSGVEYDVKSLDRDDREVRGKNLTNAPPC